MKKGKKTGVVTFASLTGSVDHTKLTPRERLETLRDFLRGPTANLAWDFGNDEFPRTLRGADVPVDECGSAACALGWWGILTDREHLWSDLAWPGSGNSCSREKRCQAEFGIDAVTAWKLFSFAERYTSHYPVRPRDVADLIDRVLDGEELERSGASGL